MKTFVWKVGGKYCLKDYVSKEDIRTLVYYDEKGALLERSNGKTRDWWTADGFMDRFEEYHEPVVHEVIRAVLFDEKANSLYTYYPTIKKSSRHVADIKITYVDGKLTVEVLP